MDSLVSTTILLLVLGLHQELGCQDGVPFEEWYVFDITIGDIQIIIPIKNH